jgi:hypothetical protein
MVKIRSGLWVTLVLISALVAVPWTAQAFSVSALRGGGTFSPSFVFPPGGDEGEPDAGQTGKDPKPPNKPGSSGLGTRKGGVQVPVMERHMRLIRWAGRFWMVRNLGIGF